jgi:hypothetical protein
VSSAIFSFPSYHSCGGIWSAATTPGGQVVNTDEQRRTAFVELERLLWRRVLGRLRKVMPEASVHVGFAVGKEPAQELA